MQKWMVINMPEKYIKASECENYFYKHLDDLHMIAAMNSVDEMPAADVTEVVRCKDCKYLMFSDFYGECGIGLLGIVSPDDYCSRGEKK